MNIKKYEVLIDKRGALLPISLKKNLPFKTKRIFIIYGKKKYYRGQHAHFKCSQFLLPIKGSVTIEYEFSGKKFKKLLSFKKKNYLLLKPKSWATIKFHSDKSMLMVFCDREYEYKDYIRNYKDFLKVIKKKWTY